MAETGPTRLRILMSVVALVLAAAGCGAAAVASAPGGATASALGTVPTPDGVQTVPPAPGPTLTGCQGSLRPTGPLPAPGAMPAGTTMAKIQQRGYLIAGVDEDSYLFGYRNPTPDPSAAPLIGFDIDFVRQIAQAIFGSPDAVHYKILTKAERLTALRDGSVDLVADILTVDCDRAAQVAFSSDYFDAGQRILVNQSSTVRGLADLAGKKVCAASGTTSIQTLADPSRHVIAVSAVNWADCLVMLQQGQVAAISTTDLILVGLEAQDPYTKIVGDRFTFERHGIGLPLHEDDMVRFVNGVLDHVRADGAWTAIYDRWIGPNPVLGAVPAPPSPIYRD